MRTRNPDGTETFYQEYGDPSNQTLVFLHGLGADHNMWQPQIQPFTDGGFHLLVPDLLGHGESSKVSSLELVDWDNQLLHLLDEKEISECFPVGVSMGGVIAQFFAVRNPEKISGLILSDTFGELKSLNEKLRGTGQLIGFYIYKMLGTKMLAKAMASAYKAPFAREAREYFEVVTKQADLNQLILARKAINRIDIIEKLERIERPALVLAGAEFGDTFIDINRKVADAIPNAPFVVLERAMDPSNLVNPEAFNREVLTFLQEEIQA